MSFMKIILSSEGGRKTIFLFNLKHTAVTRSKLSALTTSGNNHNLLLRLTSNTINIIFPFM